LASLTVTVAAFARGPSTGADWLSPSNTATVCVSTHAPDWQVPPAHAVPFATLVAVSVQLFPAAHATTPTWHAFAGTQLAPGVHATHALFPSQI
jgi:hypothetical protein